MKWSGRTYATLGHPTWNPKALPFFLYSLADRYCSWGKLSVWRGKITSTGMLALTLPMQPSVLSLPLPEGSLLDHIKLDESLGLLDLSYRAVSKQSAPTSCCFMLLFHSSCKVLHLLCWNSRVFLPLISPGCRVTPHSPALLEINCTC